jgi:membrane protease YdiL (CAAX protease family)
MKMPLVPAHPVRWAASDAVLVLLGAQLVSLLWAGAVIAGIYQGKAPDPLPVTSLVLANVGLWLSYGLGPLLVARVKGHDLRSDYGAWLRPWDVPLGLLLGMAAQLAVLPLLYLPIRRLVDSDPSQPARALVDSIQGPADAALFAFSVAIMAPLVEELFFRGLLLRALQQRFGAGKAAVGSSLLFALVHWQPLQAPGLFVFGLMVAVLALWSGRLGPSWIMHVGFNLTTLIVLGRL